MSHVVVFPGQGSQSVGMLSDLIERIPSLSQRLDQASNLLGYDLREIVLNGPEDKLNRTDITQPAVLVTSIGLWDAVPSTLKAQLKAVAGHSLGEWTALVAAGVIRFEDAVRLVSLRGQFMQQAVETEQTAMAAVLGLDDAGVIAGCREAEQGQCVDPVNFNCPGQVVIAGHESAVDRAIGILKAKGAKRAIKLAVSVPAHSALMKPAAAKLESEMQAIQLHPPTLPVYQNVSAQAETSPERIRTNLLMQLYSTVRWTETISAMSAAGATHYLECGPGKVLTGLVKKIDKVATVEALADGATWEHLSKEGA
ncbi:MAG: ACP S-malonyltransferase [Hahellaceae bacterium]|nr:ACP S-malonyltransferase [Hahellaceae bacterium]